MSIVDTLAIMAYLILVIGMAITARILFLYYTRSQSRHGSHAVPEPRDVIHSPSREAVISVINDGYSPFYRAHVTDRLYDDLGLHPADLCDLMFDIQQHLGLSGPLTLGTLSAPDADPSVADIIRYFDRLMDPQPIVTDPATSA